MFRNSGKKITVVVKVLFWLNLLLALAGAAALVCYAYSGYGMEMALMAALAAAAAVVCYMLLMYVVLLVLNAFGELAQSNLEIRLILAENRHAQEQPAYAPPAPAAPEEISALTSSSVRPLYRQTTSLPFPSQLTTVPVSAAPVLFSPQVTSISMSL